MTTPKRSKRPSKATKAAAKATAARLTQPMAPPQAVVLGALSARMELFALEYVVDFKATQAAIRAGYNPNSAQQQSTRLLADPRVLKRIEDAKKERLERARIDGDRVVLDLMAMFTADTREIVEVQVACCRYCYGEGNGYHRTMVEYAADKEKWLDKGNDPAAFDEQGGVGFNPTLLPNPECAHCAGTGAAKVVLKDSRTFSRGAALMYAGAKEGKYGIEVQMVSKESIADKLCKHLGLYEAHNHQKNAGTNALADSVKDLSTAKLLRLRDSLLQEAAEAADGPLPPRAADDGPEGKA